MQIDDAFKELGSGAGGLTSNEAHKRILEHGYNEIIERKRSKWLKFAAYFWNPLSWMIEAAALLSALIQHWEDLAIIITLLMANAAVGFWQENKADNAIELLKKKLAMTSRVLRDGTWSVMPSKELVPGDVVKVRLGDIVPADVCLMDGDYLLLDESALTGESLPVEKHRSDATFSGAIVRQGEMTALVTSTGSSTYFGRTTKLVQEAKAQSHLQKAVVRIGDYLIKIAVAMVFIVVISAALRGHNVLDVIQFGLILLVASVPIAMPAVMSVTLAVGAESLAGMKAIVTKLESIEEAAGMDVLCVDKTGTITKNDISVADIKGMAGMDNEQVLVFACLASRKEDNDPIETAIFRELDGKGIAGRLEQYKVGRYVPFNPVIKRTEADVVDTVGGKASVVAKGAPQVIEALTSGEGIDSAEFNASVEAYAADGYRAVAVAQGPSKDKLRLVGLIALHDPPREDSRHTLDTARKMGIAVKMVTGDHIAIAKEVCSEVGIGTIVVDAGAIGQGNGEMLEHADAFAEVFPEHKYSIVKTLQSRGHIVGMTGDGVNDAPALKQADVGIAVSSATDAARAAADIVLTGQGLSVIIESVAQSRKIFERMNSYAVYRIAETVRVLFLLSLAIVLFNFYPLTVLMLVLLALLNDFPIMMIAYDNARVQEKPVRWDMKGVLGLSTFLGMMGLISSFSLLLIGIYVLHLNSQTLQALMFLKLAVAGHMTLYLARTGEKHFWKRPLPALSMFSVVELTQIAATVLVVSGVLMIKLSWELSLLVWAYSLAFFAINDFAKVAFMKRFRPGTNMLQ